MLIMKYLHRIDIYSDEMDQDNDKMLLTCASNWEDSSRYMYCDTRDMTKTQQHINGDQGTD